MKMGFVLLGFAFGVAIASSQPYDHPGDPVADSSATIVLGNGRYTVLTPDLLRIEWRADPDQQFEDEQTLVVWNRRLPVPAFNFTPPTSVSTVFVIETEGFRLEGDTAHHHHAVEVALKRPSFWSNATTAVGRWTPHSSTAGNLFGTFRTWDTLNGPQDMNCTTHSPWVTTHEPEHCTFGLISKAGFATVDDSKSPILRDGWVAPQTRGTCAAAAAASSRMPCFEVQNHNNEADCRGAGCCWLDAANSSDPLSPTLSGYSMLHTVGYAYDPKLPQPNGTIALSLWYHAARHDHWSTTNASSARAAGYTLLATLGYIPVPPSQSSPPSTTAAAAPARAGNATASCKSYGVCNQYKPEHACQCDPTCRTWGNCCADFDAMCSAKLDLFFSALRADHFSSTNNCSGCSGSGYTAMGQQGYLVTELVDGTVPLALWWNAEAQDNVLAPPSLSTRCVRREGNVDTYLFTHGARYTDALRDYTRIAGRVPVPRRHMLGVSWSRWGQAGISCKWCRMDENETMQAVQAMANESLPFPLDTFVFDMNWHLKITGWTGYTWDSQWYPNHKGLLDWMHGLGLYTGANLHDAQGVQRQERMYSDAAQAMGVDAELGQPIEFHITNKTYATVLQNLVLEPLAREGLDFWWTDWQQGLGGADATESSLGLGTLDVAGLNPTIWLNHLRFSNYSQAGSNRRGLIHSRYGGLANHRYATGFGGDVMQSWQSLQFMIYTTVTASNVAFVYWAQEIMHPGGNFEQPQLFTRTVQFGAWSPVYTNWGNPKSNDNLWEFGAPFAHSMQRALAHRSMLLPLRYTLAREAHDTAVGLLRPMYYSCPFEAHAYDAPNQYMVGDDLLAAPAFTQLTCGDTCADGRSSQRVWLPPANATGVDKWITFSSVGSAAFAGSTNAPDVVQWREADPFLPTTMSAGQWITVNASIDEVPVFVKAGALLPMLPYSHAVTHGSASRQYDSLELWLYPGTSTGSAWLYEDDGISNDYLREAGQEGYLKTHVTYERDAALAGNTSDMAQLVLQLVPTGGYTTLPQQRRLTLRLIQAASMPVADPISISIDVDGVTVPGASWARQAGNRYIGPSVVVSLPPIPPLNLTVVAINFRSA